MSFFGSMNISASGLTAERLRQDVIAQNIANVDTTRTENGTAYKRKIALFQERSKSDTQFSSVFGQAIAGLDENGSLNFRNVWNGNVAGDGVRVSRIVEDETEGTKVYEPGHPDADEDGYVTKPNVNIVVEMVNMIASTRAYEANVTAMGATKSMINKTLELSSR